MNRVVINGQVLTENTEGIEIAIVKDGQILTSFSLHNPPTIKVEGDLMNLKSAISVNVVGNVNGNVKGGTSITITGDVQGNIDAGTGVQCQNVGGDVKAGTGIWCHSIAGNAKAGTGIRCG